MGIKDRNTRLGSAQAFTSTGGVATDAYVLGSTGDDLGNGEPMAVTFHLSAVSAVAGTLQFQIVTATASDGTPGSGGHATTAAITDTSLAAGSKITLVLPPGSIPLLAPTATHLTGKIILASSGTCTATIHLGPLAADATPTAYHAEPVLP